MPAGPDDDPSSSGKKRHVPGYPDRHPGRVRLLQYRCRPEGLKDNFQSSKSGTVSPLTSCLMKVRDACAGGGAATEDSLVNHKEIR